MASLDLESDIHRLEGTSGNESGGLVIMKKGPAQDGDAAHTFKRPEAPKVSLLGLDKLAASKRLSESEGSTTPKRSKVLSYANDEEDDVEEDENDRTQQKKKHKDRDR